MKKILLAINGSTPREEAARYALGLARRLKAKLRILQVVEAAGKKRSSNIRGMFRRGAHFFEETMVAATFAEAGEPQLADGIQKVLAQATKGLDRRDGTEGSPVDYDVTLRVGSLEEEVIRFVEDNRDTVLAVYDGPIEGEKENPPKELRTRLNMPWVSIKLKNKTSRGENMRSFIRSRKSGVSKLTDKMEQYQEAVTYAEADMPEEALRVMERTEKEKSMLLVVGRSHNFSEALQEYSVGLAGRLGYEILSVSAKYIPNDFLPLVSAYRDKLRQDFIAKAEEAAKEFKTRCEAAGIPFRHEVRFGEGTEVIKELHREFRQLEYVVTEPDENVELPASVSPAIPVFSLAAS